MTIAMPLLRVVDEVRKAKKKTTASVI